MLGDTYRGWCAILFRDAGFQRILHCVTLQVAIIWGVLCFQDALTERALQIIGNHNTDNPLFLFVAYHAPHIPLQVLTSPPETPCNPSALCFSQGATNKCLSSWNRFLSSTYRCTIPQMTTLRMSRLGKPLWVRNTGLISFFILSVSFIWVVSLTATAEEDACDDADSCLISISHGDTSWWWSGQDSGSLEGRRHGRQHSYRLYVGREFNNCIENKKRSELNALDAYHYIRRLMASCFFLFYCPSVFFPHLNPENLKTPSRSVLEPLHKSAGRRKFRHRPSPSSWNIRTHSWETINKSVANPSLSQFVSSRAWVSLCLCFVTWQNGGDPVYFHSNAPLRGGKSSVYEGGSRAVAFVHGPMVDTSSSQSSESSESSADEWVFTFRKSEGDFHTYLCAIYTTSWTGLSSYTRVCDIQRKNSSRPQSILGAAMLSIQWCGCD